MCRPIESGINKSSPGRGSDRDIDIDKNKIKIALNNKNGGGGGRMDNNLRAHRLKQKR